MTLVAIENRVNFQRSLEMNELASDCFENVIDIDVVSSQELDTLNPQIAEAIRSIQSERDGTEPIAWTDFSSHNKS